MKADRVRYDHRTGDVLASGAVLASIGGRRVRAERLTYRAESGTLELANLLLEGLVPDASDEPLTYSKARGRGRGGVPTPHVPSTPASSRLGVPWLTAATAEAHEDLSRIQGRQGVKIGAGGIAIEGETFDLDPLERRLSVTDAQLRLRTPRARVRARSLRASLSAAGVRIQLEGGVHASVELPFALGREGNKTRPTVVVTGDRLVARPKAKGAVAFTIEGGVRLHVGEAGVELQASRVTGRIKGRRLVLEGDLRGLLGVEASAFPDRKAPRRGWTITRTRSLSLLPPAARPAMWFGADAPPSGKLPWRIALEDVEVEGGSPASELVLYRPTW